MNRHTLIASLLLIVCGVAGAYAVGRPERGGWSIIALYGASITATTIWLYLARWGGMPVQMASVLFDVVYSFALFATLLLLGNKMTLAHCIGVVLAVGGLALLGT